MSNQIQTPPSVCPKNNAYKKWVIKHQEDLDRMYDLSGLDCPPEEFYKYIYDYSDINK